MVAAAPAVLILMWGAACAAWRVTFENPDPCAMKGSSVEFRCSYNYSEGETVKAVAWYKGEMQDGRWIRVKVADFPSIHNRSVYLGDTQHNCSLAIHDLHENDTGHYYFYFETEAFGRQSKRSIRLSVAELRARAQPSSTVRAGSGVTLVCEPSCQTRVTWFKDGEPVTNARFQARIEDAGNYTCAVEGQELVQSDPVNLDVQYPPLNVSVTVSYSGSLTPGVRVNLTCSSAANPAAENYTWYRSDVANGSSPVQVGSGQVLSMPFVGPSLFGRYLCKAQNLLGENSSTEVPMAEEAERSAVEFLLLFGFGVKVFLMPPLTVAVIWIWQICGQSATKHRDIVKDL